MEINNELIRQEKKQLRKHIRALKNSITFEEKKKRSEVIWQQVEQLAEFQQAQYVMLYWSMEDEVFTHEFVKKHAMHKKIILPAIIGDNLVLRQFEGEQNLSPDKQYQVMEPTGSTFDTPEKLGLIIVPGVAFDAQNNRLGRGKAFYDKLLKSVSCSKVGVCFDFQFVDKVPCEATDIKMDQVIHES